MRISGDKNDCIKSRNIFLVNEALTLDFNVAENTLKKTYLIALLNVDG